MRDQDNTLMAEAQALALYVSRHGDILATEHHRLHVALLKSIAASKEGASSEKQQELMIAYAKLTAVTYKQKGINGRTILDTQAKPPRWSREWLTMPKYRPAWIGVFLFIVAMWLDASARWIGNISVPSDCVFGAFF